MGLRRHRAIAVGCFCVLVLLVGAERRLAEVHLNRLAAAVAVVPAPDLTGILRVVWRPAPTAPSETVPAPPVRWSSSRSPPSAIL